jgi:AcrR family transcriptional regulator
MVVGMAKRLTSKDWIDFALKTLARAGFDALKADLLARDLGVSRGSFYWHFTDLHAFHSAVIEHWKLMATEAIITDIERHASHERRLNALLRHAFGRGAALEVRVRAWAENSVEAARALGDIDRRRREYIEQLLTEAGIPRSLAESRAQLLYWTYLGAAWSRGKLTGERLEQMVTELTQMGLAGIVRK